MMNDGLDDLLPNVFEQLVDRMEEIRELAPRLSEECALDLIIRLTGARMADCGGIVYTLLPPGVRLNTVAVIPIHLRLIEICNYHLSWARDEWMRDATEKMLKFKIQ